MRLSHQHFTCQQCGKCCRCFRVAITDAEETRFQRLQWPDGLAPQAPIAEPMGVYRFFRRDAATQSCLFLDADNRCRMHRAFGFSTKALSCRAYPFEIQTTFDGEISIAARYDCPAVASGKGADLSSQLPDLERLVRDPQMPLSSGFNAMECSHLSREAIEQINAFLIQQLQEGKIPLPALHTMVCRIEKLGTNFLNDTETMGVVLPSMRDKAAFEFKMDGPHHRNWPARIEMRRQLIYFLRRDESLPDFSFATRWHQMISVMRVYFGFGNPSEFSSSEHPSISLRDCRLFDDAYWSQPPEEELKALETYRDFLITKLETCQFFGRGYYGKPYLTALKALFGTCQAAQLLARIHAGAQQRHSLTIADGRYAAAAIDHCFGRKMTIY